MPVVNIRRGEAYDVYIGRPSKFGNPFVIGRDGTREEVVDKYRAWLWDQMRTNRITAREVAALRGKRLGCYCAPARCHGDVLMAAADWAYSQLKEVKDS